MKQYVVDVVYQSTLIKRTVVTAEDKEDAERKIRDGLEDDVIDIFYEDEELEDFIFED